MFTQEFSLPDVLRIWDSILSEAYAEPCLKSKNIISSFLSTDVHSGVLDYLVQFSFAMLLYSQLTRCVRDEIIRGDFTENMELLQNLNLDVDQVFLKIAEMRQKTSKPFEPKKIFEKFKEKYKWYNPFVPNHVQNNVTSSNGSLFEIKPTSKPVQQSIQGQTVVKSVVDHPINASIAIGSQDEFISLN